MISERDQGLREKKQRNQKSTDKEVEHKHKKIQVSCIQLCGMCYQNHGTQLS